MLSNSGPLCGWLMGRGCVCGSLSALCATSCTTLRDPPAAAPLSPPLHHLGPSGPWTSRRVGGLSGAGSIQVAQTQPTGSLASLLAT